MKNKLIAIGLALVAGITLSNAQTRPGFSVGSASVSAYTFGTTNFVAAPATGTPITSPNNNSSVFTGNTPFINYLNVSSDLSTSKLTLWYVGTNAANAATGTNSTTSVYVNTTNGIVAGSPVVIQHVTGIAEPRIATSIATAQTNIITSPYSGLFTTNLSWVVVVNAAPTYTVNQGDQMFGYTIQGTIPVGTNTLVAGPAAYVLAGQYQTPLLMSVNFTSAGTINVATGTFQ